MCRRSSVIPVLLAGLLVALPSRGDEVAAFLQRHNLGRLLAVHYEQLLEDADASQRESYVRQLADLYADLLESETDATERGRLEQRGRELVSTLPARDAGALRLALLRGAYRTAERIAENHRLRLSEPPDLAQAIAILDEIVPKFNQLRSQLNENLAIVERRLSRAIDEEAAELHIQAQQVRAVVDECTFYHAWALYYASWISGRSDQALTAQRLFGELLDTETSHPDPSDVSIDLRSLESVARSILGLALCKSLTASPASALNWMRLLEHENAFEPLRNEAPIWEMVILLEHGEYASAQDVLDDYLATGARTPSPWLRLIAVHCLDRSRPDRRADDLVRYAVTELASREELDQILDLAQRYGAESLGGSGFALRYVTGVMIYSRTRTTHGNDRPIADPGLIEDYSRAATELERALTEPDVSDYVDAAAACRRLVAYCRFFQGRFLEARQWFELAASLLTLPEEAAAAMWMAIVSLDKVVVAGGNNALRAELNLLLDEFLENYPSSEYAPRIVLKRSIVREEVSDEAIHALLAVPSNSEVYETARTRAASLLYQLFRKASGETRRGYAIEYLGVALPLTVAAMAQLELSDEETRGDLVNRCRIVLEVALSDGVGRLSAARSAFDWLEELEASGGIDLSSHVDELTFRHLQERLASGDVVVSIEHADALWARAEASIWSRLASRAMFREAHRAWKDAPDPQALQDDILRRLQRYGGRILLETAGRPGALNDSIVRAYHATVAEALMLLWERAGQERDGRAALTRYERLLDHQPNNSGFLRATALLAGRLGQAERALECWRTLVAGTELRSDAWFEAKFHQIALLAKSDPERARAVLVQHIQLNPDYGPEPWGARLKGLELSLEDDDAAGAGEEGGP